VDAAVVMDLDPLGNLSVVGGLKSTGILEYADNTAALSGGLVIGDFYRTGDLSKIVH
jgi:hypothetical protein